MNLGCITIPFISISSMEGLLSWHKKNHNVLPYEMCDALLYCIETTTTNAELVLAESRNTDFSSTQNNGSRVNQLAHKIIIIIIIIIYSSYINCVFDPKTLV